VIPPILDHTALGALVKGHVYLSRFACDLSEYADQKVVTPAICFAAAEASRVGTAEHVLQCFRIGIDELGASGAATVGRLLSEGVDWPLAHAVVAGRPSPEWPSGRTVITAIPERYEGLGITVLPIPELN
jgi:hypothetical protein